MNMYNTRAYKFIMENKAVNMQARGKNSYYARTSMVLPGVLLVEHWPSPGWAQYEWYVPTDDKHHEYWEMVVGRCRNEEERREAEYLYDNFFEPLALRDFNDNDLFAREAMQDFYAARRRLEPRVAVRLRRRHHHLAQGRGALQPRHPGAARIE